MLDAVQIRFTKMHGAGNDFVVIDSRAELYDGDTLDAARRRALANRHTGIGFDQMLVIEPPRRNGTDAWLRIFNADGTEVQQCGNGLRCVALYLHDVSHRQRNWRLDGLGGRVDAIVEADGSVSVAMSAPVFGAKATGARSQSPVTIDSREVAFAPVSMGNPHAVVAVDDVADAPVATLGSALQEHFEDGVNVGFAQRRAADELALRVYERGAGETLACGTGACAAAVVAMRATPGVEEIAVHLPGGRLMVRWAGDGEPVWLRGPAQRVFEGSIDL